MPAEGREQSLAIQLKARVAALDGALDPSALSCGGADGHRKAICSIADQICDIAKAAPGLTSAATRCDEGRKLCEDANAKYRQRCN